MFLLRVIFLESKLRTKGVCVCVCVCCGGEDRGRWGNGSKALWAQDLPWVLSASERSQEACVQIHSFSFVLLFKAYLGTFVLTLFIQSLNPEGEFLTPSLL